MRVCKDIVNSYVYVMKSTVNPRFSELIEPWISPFYIQVF